MIAFGISSTHIFQYIFTEQMKLLSFKPTCRLDRAEATLCGWFEKLAFIVN